MNGRDESAALESRGLEYAYLTDDTVHATLWYPRLPDARKRVVVSLGDVRAADDLTIVYDFERDGWSITREIVSENEVYLLEGSDEWVEVAFVPAWTERERTA